MNKTGLLFLFGLCGAATCMQSCHNDDDTLMYVRIPNAIVTVCPDEDGSFVMNLDENTTLIPTNVPTSPFGNKEVRAFVNISEQPVNDAKHTVKEVHVNWIDSICTKTPVPYRNDFSSIYGSDHIELMNNWTTVAEDGYITLHIKTAVERPGTHDISLVGNDPEDPFSFEICHNANGDVYGKPDDIFVAFNLNDMPSEYDKVPVKLSWKTYNGYKKTTFILPMRGAKD